MTIKRILLIIFSVIILGLLAAAYPSANKFYLKLKETEKKLAEALVKNKLEKIREERILCMTKTLVVAYDLDKWMAHYLSVIFNDFSEAYNIPWEIYPSIVRIESGFKTTSVSTKGAKGLMQIIEATGKGVASDIDIPYIESQTLWNEIHNLSIGCSYLSNNIKKLGLEGGVKAYLGGPAYLKTAAASADKKIYINEYKSSVWLEYKRLAYIYRGVVDEQKSESTESYSYDEIRTGPYYKVPLDLDLFNDSLAMDSTLMVASKGTDDE